MAVIAILLIVITMVLPALNKAKSHMHFARWQAYTHSLERSEGVVTYYGFQDGGGDRLQNSASALTIEPYAPQELHAAIGPEVKWAAGRWMSKYGLAFSGGSGPDHQVNGGGYQTWEETSLTVSVWCRIDAVGGRYGLVTRYAPDAFLWGVEVTPAGNISFYVVDAGDNVASVESSQSVPVGEWISIIASYDDESDTMKLYVDGRLVTEETAGLAHDLKQDRAGTLYIGDYPALSITAPDGMIDEVIVWNEAIGESLIHDFVKMSDQ